MDNNIRRPILMMKPSCPLCNKDAQDLGYCYECLSSVLNKEFSGKNIYFLKIKGKSIITISCKVKTKLPGFVNNSIHWTRIEIEVSNSPEKTISFYEHRLPEYQLSENIHKTIQAVLDLFNQSPLTKFTPEEFNLASFHYVKGIQNMKKEMKILEVKNLIQVKN